MSFDEWWTNETKDWPEYGKKPDILKTLKQLAHIAWKAGYSEGYEKGFTDGGQDTYNPTEENEVNEI